MLHHAGDDGGARRVGQVAVEGEVENRVVRRVQAVAQEAQRIVQGGTRLALEGLYERARGDAGGDLAVLVATHAVGDEHQQRLARI